MDIHGTKKGILMGKITQKSALEDPSIFTG